MRLTASNAAIYLLGRRLLTGGDVVDRGVVAFDASRRNRNVKLRWREGDGLFLKQFQSADPQEAAALRREACCCDLSQRYPALGTLDRLMPRLRFADPGARILTFDLVAGGESLHAFHLRTRSWPAPVGEALGAALAALHDPAVPAAIEPADRSALFPGAPPWILSTHEMRAEQLTASVSPANRQLIDLVRRHPGFAEALNGLKAGWRPEALIHGDMKWDNCLVAWPEGDGGFPRVVFVDWELADLGDPCWDVGALLQAYLMPWLTSVPPTPGVPPARLAGLAAVPLGQVQPAVGALWRRYAADRGLTGERRSAALDRCVRAAGARMIQTAYESLAGADSLNPAMLLLLQVSLNVLTRPADAAGQLLAIE
jgi:aminoglycoside phosphotransferase (APT) family kinase protein